MGSPEPPVSADSALPTRVLFLLGGFGAALLAVLLWSGYRLSQPRPEPVISEPALFGIAPAGGDPALPLGPSGAPAWGGPVAASPERRLGRRARPPMTTGLVLRSPLAAAGSGGRESTQEERPTVQNDRRTESRRSTGETPAAGAPPSRRPGSGNGAAALGGSLGLEDLSPPQTSFGASPFASPAGGSGGG
jgi:hypothetical protein